MSAADQERPPELLVAAPLPGYPPEVGEALWRLEEGGSGRCTCWRTWRPKWSIASPAATPSILYHVALIETDWLFAEILEQPVPDEFAAWLPVDDRDGAGMLTVVRD